MANELGRRLKYWTRRLGNLRFRSVVDAAKRVSAVSGKPVPVVLADMAWCTFRYDSGYVDYEDYEYYLLNAAERATVLSNAMIGRIMMRFNAVEHRETFRDKRQFNRVFGHWLGREWLDVDLADPDAVAAFVRRHGTVIAKPIGTEAGHGIELVRAADVSDPVAFRDQLLARGPVLLEELIVQHEAMSRLAPDSVNGIRIVTFIRDGEVTVLEQVLKMGTGSFVDNHGSGGLYTMLDDDGVSVYPAMGDASEPLHEVHPTTGVPLVGFQVPDYPQVVALARRLAAVVPEVAYVGWDLAVTEHGPVVIEGNDNSGSFWIRPSVSGQRIGRLPYYREVMGF